MDAILEENRLNTFISFDSGFPCSAQGMFPVIVRTHIGPEGGAVEIV
jgi:hypothetical protein